MTIDNSKKDPLFVLRFKDSFNNVLIPPKDASFKARLLVPKGAKTAYDFEVKSWGSEAVLIRILDSDYKVFKSELRNENANLTIQGISRKGWLQMMMITPMTMLI